MAAASRKSSLVQTSQVRLCTSATLQHATRRGRQLGNGWARSPTRSGRHGSLEIAARVAQSHHHSRLKEGLSFSVVVSLSSHRAPPGPQNASLAKRGLKEVCAPLASPQIVPDALEPIKSEVPTAAGAGLFGAVWGLYGEMISIL